MQGHYLPVENSEVSAAVIRFPVLELYAMAINSLHATASTTYATASMRLMSQ